MKLEYFLLQIQHEVTHLGVVHKLCSDECFARFRSSRNLYMSYCENCGNCNASGNYHLVQIEDGIKKFCTTDCITTFKQVHQHYQSIFRTMCVIEYALVLIYNQSIWSFLHLSLMEIVLKINKRVV